MADFQGQSLIYFKDGRIYQASNDGMELLGHFLLSQVGFDRTHFFIKWLGAPQDDTITSGPYMLEKTGDDVTIDHLDNDRVMPFTTNKKRMIEIIKQWGALCGSEAHSACKVGGYDVSLVRSGDGNEFTFHTLKVH